MKKVLKWIALLLGIVVLIAGVGLLVLTVTEYRPAERETIAPQRKAAGTLAAGTAVHVLSWNIGYGALGDNADFFMDGGRMVNTADAARVERNMADIRAFLEAEAPDLILLQETDVNSDRSHHVDESAALAQSFPAYEALFAYNYKALYVPYPLPPIGHVEAGLLTLSTYPIAAAERVQLPCPFSWPMRLINLKRCLSVSRIPVEGTGRELVLINLHLEAYDDGAGKTAQTAMLADLLSAEADKGNYVIAGGDFNQVFSNVDTSRWPVRAGMWTPGVIDAAAFDARFSLLMDGSAPTCRYLDRPYAGADRDQFQYYLIDGFIVSDNVRVERLETVPLDFQAADHNPVRLTAILLPDQPDQPD